MFNLSIVVLLESYVFEIKQISLLYSFLYIPNPSIKFVSVLI